MTAAILAALGFMALIVLHELGHFAVAKAVGMRVERFSLFFPPLIWRRQGKGETEYAIGAIPLGGYVKISGMNPHEATLEQGATSRVHSFETRYEADAQARAVASAFVAEEAARL